MKEKEEERRKKEVKKKTIEVDTGGHGIYEMPMFSF